MSEANIQKVPKRVLTSLLASVSAGVVPRTGAPYIAIGREDEIAALLSAQRQSQKQVKVDQTVLFARIMARFFFTLM